MLLNISFTKDNKVFIINDIFNVMNSKCIINNYAPPGDFNLLTPANNSNQPPGNIHFTWETSSNADYYRIIVDDNSDFSSPVLDKSYITVTFYDYSFNTQGRYYWKVIAYNNEGQRQCRYPFTFTITGNSIENVSLGNIKILFLEY